MLYALMPIWLVAVTTLMVVRLKQPASTRAIPNTPMDQPDPAGHRAT